jgi:hypothetical protein
VDGELAFVLAERPVDVSIFPLVRLYRFSP